MIPDRLFDLALNYKKTKLWKKLWDSQMFAVRFSDGGIGYCVVMGMLGEMNAIAVYPGQSGLDSIRAIHDETPEDDVLAQAEHMHCQDCLMLSFNAKADLLPDDIEDITDYCKRKGVALRGKNAFPQFERFRPGYAPWYMEDEKDFQYMAEGLEAALEVSCRLTEEMKTPEMLGIFEGAPYNREIPLLVREEDGYRWLSHIVPPRAEVQWPPIRVEDDLSVARLSKVPQKGEWAVKLFRHIDPLSSEADDGDGMISIDDLTSAPFFPWTMIIVNAKTGYVLTAELANDPEDYTRTFAQTLVNTAGRAGLPKKIIVLDDRTAQALSAFCQRYGIALERKKRCKALTDALDDMVAHFGAMDEEDMDFSMDDILQALRDPELIRAMPDEALIQILALVPDGALPDDIMQALNREAERRGFFK